MGAEPVFYGGNDDGQTLGIDSTDKVSFYGIDPVEQQALAAGPATTLAVSTTNNWGFSGSTQANAIVTLVNDMRAELIEVGLFKSA